MDIFNLQLKLSKINDSFKKGECFEYELYNWLKKNHFNVTWARSGPFNNDIIYDSGIDFLLTVKCSY